MKNFATSSMPTAGRMDIPSLVQPRARQADAGLPVVRHHQYRFSARRQASNAQRSSQSCCFQPGFSVVPQRNNTTALRSRRRSARRRLSPIDFSLSGRTSTAASRRVPQYQPAKLRRRAGHHRVRRTSCTALPARRFLHSLDYPEQGPAYAADPDPLLLGPASRVIEDREKVCHDVLTAPNTEPGYIGLGDGSATTPGRFRRSRGVHSSTWVLAGLLQRGRVRIRWSKAQKPWRPRYSGLICLRLF